ncbi:MAG TPA: 16S rRNA (cytosine(967)-C(5))-methyltransferase RsmB [Blastocatellia bacterium]|jgi:16S rRNA (cytosine967-C5)-methyltransferase
MKSKSSKPAISPARRAAFDILRRVEVSGAYASVLIAELPASGMSREDRALAQEITLGVLRWQRALDYFIERYSRRPPARLDPEVLIALRIGIYQLRHLSRVPERAAVNESVNLVKFARKSSAAGMVNAVLRSAATHLDDAAGDGIDDSYEKLSVETSHPRWLLERWESWLGADSSLRLALANNEHPPLAFRVNTLSARVEDSLAQLAAAGVLCVPSKIAPGAYTFASGPPSAIAEAVERGSVYIQDEASQLVSLLLAPQPDETILDLCAAPGSKTTHIAALSRDNAWVMACDLYPHRLATLAASCSRLGVHSVDPVALDATRDLPVTADAPRFDRALLDAPCTGTGTLRRNPEIKWRLGPEAIPRLASIQMKLLQRASARLRVGGRLVYSTCSLEREEGEEIIKRFLEGGAPFRLIAPQAPDRLLTEEGFVRTFPHIHNTDGFFAAVLEREG